MPEFPGSHDDTEKLGAPQSLHSPCGCDLLGWGPHQSCLSTWQWDGWGFPGLHLFLIPAPCKYLLGSLAWPLPPPNFLTSAVLGSPLSTPPGRAASQVNSSLSCDTSWKPSHTHPEHCAPVPGWVPGTQPL